MNEHVSNQLNGDELIPILIDKYGYPPQGARLVATQLSAADPVIRGAFQRWWDEGIIDASLDIQGYTATRLLNEHGMNPIAALLTLDWLLREPARAIASLRRGHDRVE